MSVCVTDKHTFFHHSGSSSSQIDYILATHQNIVKHYEVSDRETTNSSSHVYISALLAVMTPGDVPSLVSSRRRAIKYLQWNKIDKTQYQMTLDREVQKMSSSRSIKSLFTVGERLGNLSDLLHKAASKAVPAKVIKLKGPAWKASATVNDLLRNCNYTYKLWAINSDKKDDVLKKDNIQAKRDLRKQLMKEKYEDRKNFYDDLMSNQKSSIN